MGQAGRVEQVAQLVPEPCSRSISPSTIEFPRSRVLGRSFRDRVVALAIQTLEFSVLIDAFSSIAS
jgi:hypothetical protein